MQVLRTLFWVLLAVLVVVFAMNNWRAVDIALWGGLIVSINLPFLIGLSFLLGFLPTFLWYRAIRWRLHSRLSTSERELTALRTPTDAPADPIVPPAEPEEPRALEAPSRTNPPAAPPAATP